MISIVIPLYNKERSVAHALNSVLKQSFQDFEIVVVDDGSTDGSCDEVYKVTDPRIRLVHQQNAGVSAARNKGIAEARGEYVAFLDADDEWKPDYLATQMALVEKYRQCSVFAVNYEFRNEKGETTPTIIRKLPFSGMDGVLTNYFEVASCSHPPICSISIMVLKEAIQAIGGFPVGVRSGEDLLTWARLACRYKIAYTRKICSIYNLGEGYDMSNLPPRKQDAGDPVGKGLKELYKCYSTKTGLKKYISHWHKMRASVALRYGEKKETIEEVFMSLRYNVLNLKVIPFLFLALLPHKVRYTIISRYK